MAKRYFNTTLGLSMLPDGQFSVRTVEAKRARMYLSHAIDANMFENIANPNHGNMLDAVSGLLDIDVRQAKGGRVRLALGDQCLVVEVGNLPPQRETREYSDEEIAAAKFSFRIVMVY
ncbi:MAG: hypothetical protein Q8R30_00625 [bacterium]|nr:hypothetical protein [bacterium]